jgi:streptogramin lyase
MALFAALMLSGRISSRTTGKRTLRRLLLVISFTFLIATFASEKAVATIILEKTLPTDGAGARSPFAIAAAKNSSFVVFAEKHAGKIGFMGTGQCRVNGSFNGIFVEFDLPGDGGATAEPRDVALGNQSLRSGGWGLGPTPANASHQPELYIYFTEFVRNRIGRLNWHTGIINEYAVPTLNSGPWNLAIDPYNGSIWFTEYQGNRIGRLFYVPGGFAWRFIEYCLPTPNSYPVDIAVDPNYWHNTAGEAQTYVWFTMSGSDKIGRLNSETGEIVEFSTRGTPFGITVTPQSFVWFTQKLGDRIAKLHPWSGLITEIPLPVHSPGNEPLYIANDTDNNLWFTESANNIVGKYIPGANVFQEYVVPTTASKPHGIALTPRLWGPGLQTSPVNHYGTFSVFFTEEVGNKIGKIIIPSGSFITTTTVGYVSSASTTTSSLTTLTTAATSTVTSTATSSYSTKVLGHSNTYQNVTTTVVDTISILVTSTTSTWTKTTTSTSVSTTSQTSTSVTTSTTTSGTTTTVTSTSTTTSTSSTTTTTTTSTTYTSTSYSPTVTTPVTVGTTSMYSSTTTTTTTSTATETSAVLLATTTTTVATATVTPAGRACVIASVAYGSELAPEVQFLRGFRDGPVVATFAGAQFMSVFNAFYYSFSPKVAELVGGTPVLQPITRAFIYPLLGSLRLAAAICQLCPQASQLMVVIAGVIASSMIGLVYVSPILVLFGTILRKVKDPRGE